jgi:predicted dehydrogenase
LKDKYKAAVIGCGRIGSIFDQHSKRKIISTHCGAYSNHNLTELIAVSDINKDMLDNCKQFWQIENGYLSYEEMLNEESIDILSICTYNDSHLPIVKQAVKNNVKVILCEKPIADNLEDAEEIISLCKKNNVKLSVNHFRRNDDLFKEIKKDIFENYFGEVQFANFYYTRGIANSGSHLFDLIRYLFGEVKSINAYKSIKDYGEDPTISAIIEFNNSITCNIIGLDGNNYRVFDLEIFGSKKVIKINSAKNIELFKSRNSLRSSEFNELFAINHNYLHLINSQYFLNTIDNLIESIEGKKDINCSGLDGLKSLELILATNVSSEENTKLEVPFNLPLSRKIISN